MRARVPPDFVTPRWAWLTLAALTALVLLPLYLRWFGWASGACVSSRVLETLMPRVG